MGKTYRNKKRYFDDDYEDRSHKSRYLKKKRSKAKEKELALRFANTFSNENEESKA